MWDFTLVKFYCQTLFFFIFLGRVGPQATSSTYGWNTTCCVNHFLRENKYIL